MNLPITDILRKIAEEIFGYAAVILETNKILPHIQDLIKEPLKLKNEFHMTIGMGHDGRDNLNQPLNDLDTLENEKIIITTDKLLIGDKYAVLRISDIKPNIKVISNTPHITVALTPEAKPMRSKNLITGEEPVHHSFDVQLTLTGNIKRPAKTEKGAPPTPKKTKGPLEEEKSNLNALLFRSKTIPMTEKKNLSQQIAKAESLEELEKIKTLL